ncbi:MAG: DivIVA domain-containing protein [Thermonemataceae bacterium]
MKITPIEIRQKTFEKVFRGYDKEEVSAFLQSLSQEWERINTALRDTKMRLEMADKEVSQLREVETSLFKTLKTADDTAANLVDQAKKDAELKVKEAQIKADEILNDARIQARNIIQKAENKASKVMQEMIGELKSLENDYKTLITHKENLTLEIKNFVQATLEKVNRFEEKGSIADDFNTRIKEAQRYLEEQEELSQPSTKKNKKDVKVQKDNTSNSNFFDQI